MNSILAPVQLIADWGPVVSVVLISALVVDLLWRTWRKPFWVRLILYSILIIVCGVILIIITLLGQFVLQAIQHYNAFYSALSADEILSAQLEGDSSFRSIYLGVRTGDTLGGVYLYPQVGHIPAHAIGYMTLGVVWFVVLYFITLISRRVIAAFRAWE